MKGCAEEKPGRVKASLAAQSFSSFTSFTSLVLFILHSTGPSQSFLGCSILSIIYFPRSLRPPLHRAKSKLPWLLNPFHHLPYFSSSSTTLSRVKAYLAAQSISSSTLLLFILHFIGPSQSFLGCSILFIIYLCSSSTPSGRDIFVSLSKSHPDSLRFYLLLDALDESATDERPNRRRLGLDDSE